MKCDRDEKGKTGGLEQTQKPDRANQVQVDVGRFSSFLKKSNLSTLNFFKFHTSCKLMNTNLNK